MNINLLIIFGGISATACAQPEPTTMNTTTESKAWTQHTNVLAFPDPGTS